MKKITKHDKLIENIEERLKSHFPDGFSIKNKEYFKNNRCLGEIDLLFTYNDHILLFEMKSNDCVKKFGKAVGQLNRHERTYYKDYYRNYKLHKFYVSQKKNKDYVIKKVV